MTRPRTASPRNSSRSLMRGCTTLTADEWVRAPMRLFRSRNSYPNRCSSACSVSRCSSIDRRRLDLSGEPRPALAQEVDADFSIRQIRGAAELGPLIVARVARQPATVALRCVLDQHAHRAAEELACKLGTFPVSELAEALRTLRDGRGWYV